MNTGETTVLVVEPDLDTQQVYRQRLIHDPDIKLIGICSSIASATALLAQTNCDILFTELNLPDGDGLDFIRRASEDLAVQSIVAVRSEHLLPHGHGAHQEDLPQAAGAFPRRSGLRSRPARKSSGHVIQKPKARTFGFFLDWVFYFFKTQSPLLPPCFSSRRISVMHMPRSTALSMS